MKNAIKRKSELYKGQTFSQKTEKDLKTNIIRKPILKEHAIWDAFANWDVILTCDKNFGSQNKVISRVTENFRRLVDLKKQNKKIGEVASVQPYGYIV